ncbi:Arrestin [Nymphon striatum]|nr:Arrestin [Nymphon striatum]
MGVFKVFKKTAPNGKLTLYLGKRDFVDHIKEVDPIDGVVLLDETFRDRKVFGQLVAEFRYGREQDEIMGLHFSKELYLASEQIFPMTKKIEITKSQDKLLSRLGPNAFAFSFQIPKDAPASVTIQPGADEMTAPCGVQYFLKIFVGESADEKPHKRHTITLGIRKIQYAPSTTGKQPCTVIRKDFLLSPGQMEIEVRLDKQIYHHGEMISVSMSINNFSNKTVKKISASVTQSVDISMFTSGQYKTSVANIETQEGCPVSSGSAIQKTIMLRPILEYNLNKRGVALDGKLKNQDLNLASSTLEAIAEVPFILMHPKPSARPKVQRGDTKDNDLEVAQFKSSRENTIDLDDENVTAEDVVFEDFARLKMTKNQ